MDNLTHGLIGYTLYKLSAPEQVLDARLEKGLLWSTVLAAELPDIDMVSYFMGHGATLVWHRTYTHSILAIVFFAFLITAAVARFWPGLNKFRVWALTLTAGLSHIFSDVLTSYGTKVLLPWNTEPLALDVLPIVDPVLLIILGAFLWLSIRRSRKITLCLVAILAVCYVGVRAEIHQVTLQQVHNRFPAAEQVIVMPSIGSILDWRFCVKNQDGFKCGTVHLGGNATVDTTLADIKDSPAVQAVGGTKTVQAYLRRFPQFTAYKVVKEAGLIRVMVFDARYASPDRVVFANSVWLDEDLNIVREEIN